MNNPCIFSKDRKYRYTLLHEWDESLPKIAFCSLNPSVADENQLDPTLRRIKGFSKSWGFGGFYMLNLFAFRATDPKVMKQQGLLAVGNLNDYYIQLISDKVEVVVASWGVHGGFLDRDKEVIRLVPNLYYLDLTKNGFPKHPLYLKSDLTLKPLKYS